MYFLYNSLTKGEISTSNSKICGGYTSSGNKNPTPFPTVTSKSIKGMGVFFQAIHPVEYSKPIPQEMAEEIIQQGVLRNLT